MGRRKNQAKGKNTGAIPKTKVGQANQPAASNEGKGKKDKKSAKNMTEEQKIKDETSTVSKTECLVDLDSKNFGRLSTQPGGIRDQAFFVSAPPLPAEAIDKNPSIWKFLKPETPYERKFGKDSVASRFLQQSALNRKRAESKSKSKGNQSLSASNVYKDFQKALSKHSELTLEDLQEATITNTELIEPKSPVYRFKGYRNKSLDLLSLDVQKELLLQHEEIESRKEGNKLTPMQHGSVSDGRKLSLGLKSPKLQPPAFKNKIEETSLKIKGNETNPIKQSIQDIDERILTLKPKKSESKKGFQDIDEKKLISDLKNSQLSQRISSKKEDESQSKANEPLSLSQDFNVMEVSKGICNLDLNNSESKKNSLLDAKEPETEEREETMHLKRDVNLRFEFDNLGNKIIWLNGKKHFDVDQNQKLSFKFGDDNLKLSFNNNKVSIFAEESDIDCSLGKNGVVFSVADSSITRSSSLTDDPNTKVSRSNDAAGFENNKALDGSDIAIEAYPGQSQAIHPEKISKDNSSLSKTDSLLEPYSVLECFKNTTDKFLKTIIDSCNDYKKTYPQLLTQQSEANYKK